MASMSVSVSVGSFSGSSFAKGELPGGVHRAADTATLRRNERTATEGLDDGDAEF
jgi:hypothetical protein